MLLVVSARGGNNYGNWLVRKNGRILSNHNKKSRAIKMARKKAMSGERIVVQNRKGKIIRNFKKK